MEMKRLGLSEKISVTNKKERVYELTRYVGFVTIMAVFLAARIIAQEAESKGIPLGTRVEYKQVDGKTLSMWVLEPKDVGAKDSSPARAAVVLFHGGGWTGGRPAQMNPQAKAIAEHGGVAILVQYRLMPDRSQPPRICIEDSKSAVRFVRAHVRQWNIDPQKVVVGGASAGGYDAAFVTMTPGWDASGGDTSISAAANAMVLWNPVIDTSESGYAHEAFGAQAKKLSPMTYLGPQTPPMLIQAGEDDIWIHSDVLRAFQAQAKTYGVRCDLELYPGQKHGFFNREPYLSRTTSVMINFLSSLGYVRP
jgi:acetyl esterase/lipase